MIERINYQTTTRYIRTKTHDYPNCDFLMDELAKSNVKYLAEMEALKRRNLKPANFIRGLEILNHAKVMPNRGYEAFRFCWEVLTGRGEEFEKIILRNETASFQYCRLVIRKRWWPFEERLRCYPSWGKRTKDYFRWVQDSMERRFELVDSPENKQYNNLNNVVISEYSRQKKPLKGNTLPLKSLYRDFTII